VVLALLTALALAWVALPATVFGGPPEGKAAAKGDLNLVQGFKVEKKADGVEIRVAGSRQATYSAFKLDRPLRLLVDINNSQLGQGVTRAPVTIQNGIIEQVAVMDFSDELQQVTRVIVSFENPAVYDVRSEGNDLVIFIEGAGAQAPSAQNDSAKWQEEARQKEADLERARQALQAKEQRLAETERKVGELERALRDAGAPKDRDALQRTLEEERALADGLRKDLLQRESRIQDLEGSVSALERRVDDIQRERDASQKRADALAQERDVARQEADRQAERSAQSKRDLERLERELQKAQGDLQRAESARQTSFDELQKARTDLEKQRTLAQSRDEEASKIRAQLATLDKARQENPADAPKIDEESRKKREELKALEGRLEKLTGELAQKEKGLKALEQRAQTTEAERQKAAEQAESARRQRAEQLSESQKSEQERLAALERARKAEEERLANLKQAREKEEERLSALQRQGGAAPGAESRLATVSDDKDQAIVQLKGDATGAIVETPNGIKSVRFQQKGEVSRIVIELEKPGKFENIPLKNGKASLLFKGIELPRKLERTLDTQAFGGPVKFVSSFQEKDGMVRVVAEVPSANSEIIRQDGNSLYWEFSSLGAGESLAENTPPAPQGSTSAPPTYNPNAQRAAELDLSAPPWQRRPARFPRKRLSIDLRGADIQNVLRLIADEASINIVAGNGVVGSVTMRLENVPLADAFITILKSLGMGYEQDGEVYRVAPATEFASEAQRRRQDLVDSFPLEPLEIVLMPVNYGEASQIGTLVGTVLSSRGTVSVDNRTNTLIIKDVAQNLAAAQQLILSLDTQTPLVLIEARIVETNDRFSRQFGVQWGGDFLFSSANGNPTGLAFPSTLGVSGAANDGQAPVSGLAGNPNFAVNLPAPIGTGSGGGLGFTFGSLGNSTNLSLRLSALETEGQIKIVSSPKILTLDNQSATISQGTSIPVSVVSAAGVQTQFINANLQLDVRPHVTQDGNVMLEINITKSEPDFENTGARGDPSILNRSARTQLLVNDGDTTVIGGIYNQTTGHSSNKVPFLGDIPILGFFFRDYSENELRSELLIFITPRIVNRENALRARRLNAITNPNPAGTVGTPANRAP
jgi:type IV pilus assembly protein PilQ